VLGSLLTQGMASGMNTDKTELSFVLDQIFLIGAMFVGVSLLASIWIGNARLVQPSKG
jgi:hypothetical protein